MPKLHAKCSASKAERWMHCPGSIALEDQCRPEKPSEYASEGTLAHKLAELKVRATLMEEGDPLHLYPEEYEGLHADVRNDPQYSGEMEEATDFYVERIQEAMNAADDPEVLVEQAFRLDKWIPEGFGTSDAVVLSDNTIEVFDLKYGTGVKVEAPGNPQLRLYGLGAAALFGDLYDIELVRMTIIQPRLDHVSSEILPLADLLRWAETEVAPKAQAAMDGTGEIEAGDWCRWCPAKEICRARAEKQLELAREDFAFEKPPFLSDDEIGEVLQKAEALAKWAGEVKEYALAEAKAGHKFAGWKLVEGRSVRKYVDEMKVAQALKGAGYDEAMLYERKLYGITAMEKLVGKKHLTEVLGDLIHKPPGKPVLVPESDKRKELNSAQEDFKEDL